MNINELVIDAYKTLGQSMFLTEVRPVYEYRNGTRTDTVSGYKYFAGDKGFGNGLTINLQERMQK